MGKSTEQNKGLIAFDKRKLSQIMNNYTSGLERFLAKNPCSTWEDYDELYNKTHQIYKDGKTTWTATAFYRN